MDGIALRGAVLTFTDMTEMLGISMKVSIMGGLVLALPVVVYELVMFIAPGLTPRERRYLLLFLPGVTVSFVLGVLFGYFVLLPPALRFLLTFNTDIADGWEREGEDYDYFLKFSPQAYALGINVVLYSLSH